MIYTRYKDSNKLFNLLTKKGNDVIRMFIPLLLTNLNRNCSNAFFSHTYYNSYIYTIYFHGYSNVV